MSAASIPPSQTWDADTVKGYIKPFIPTLAAEWGIELTGKIRDSWIECRAVDREDTNPSAAIHQDLLVYKDLGSGSEAISIFDLAIKAGAYKDFPSAVNGLGERFNAPPKYPRVVRPPDPMPKKKKATYATFEDAREGERRWAGDVVATSHYSPTFKRVRYQGGKNGKRKFIPFHIDDDGRWVASNPEGLLPLYRLEELEQMETGRVFFTEGEKCADLVATQGLTSTTSPFGSTTTVGVDWAPLAGLEVIILPDHDEPGEKFATKLVDTLANLEPRPKIRVLRLPGLGDTEDVEQWLERLPDGIEDTAAELNRLADAAPDPTRPEYATLADALAEIGDTRWFWEKWIPAGCMTLLAAVGGGGKTRTAVDLARRLWYGLPMPDGSPNQFPPGTRTLWVMYDRNWAETGDVAKNFGVPPEAILLPSLKLSPLETPDFDDPRTMDALKLQIELEKPGLIVIDTITYATSRNTSKADEAKAAFDGLMQLAATTGVAVLALTHLNKEGEVLGRRITERARSVIMLSLPDPEGQPNRRKLQIDKTAVKKPDPLGITFTDTSSDYDANPPDAPDQPGKKRGPLPVKSTKDAEWLWEKLSGGPMRVKVLVDVARKDGILKVQTAENPDPSIGSLYNAKKRIPFIRPGCFVDETKIGNGTIWSLAGTCNSQGQGEDDDLDFDGWPQPRKVPADFDPKQCIRCKKAIGPGEYHTAWEGDIPVAECHNCMNMLST